MTADEARVLTIECPDVDISKLENYIRGAARSGRYTTEIFGFLTKPEKLKLSRLGFRCTDGEHCSSISWSDL